MTTTKQGLICLLGNSGCGKSSIGELINAKSDENNKGIIAIERDNGSSKKYGLDLGLVDKLTLEYTLHEENFSSVQLPDQTSYGEQIFWIVLDCDIETILKRIQGRSKGDIIETRKALFYYQQRFRQLSAHFGLPLIDTTQRTSDEVCDQVLDLVHQHVEYYRSYRQIGTQRLDYDFIQLHDVETILYPLVEMDDDVNMTPNLPEYAEELQGVDRRKLYIRWYVNHHRIQIDQQGKMLTIGNHQIPIKETIFKLLVEGESKKVYQDISGNPLTTNLVFIVLKSTIYSHSQQVTGEINRLGSIRARGSQLFLEMMWRNGLKHSYRSINTNGIIVSDLIERIPPVEIIVKRYCEGTDKNSFEGILEDQTIVVLNSDDEYLTGPYVRFDWRNPNHISPETRKSLSKNPYYYIYEQSVGKEEFFKKILTNSQYALPMGDKNITEDLLNDVIDIQRTKSAVLKMFMVIQSYFTRVHLVIKDVCFMLDRKGDCFWSEINQSRFYANHYDGQ